MKDVAYYAKKIKDLQEGVRNISFMVNNNDGTTEVWSSGSDEEEVCRPTHVRCLMARTTKVKNSSADTQLSTAKQVASIIHNYNILNPANQIIIDEISRDYRISKCQLNSVFRDKGEAEEKSLKVTFMLEDKKLEIDTLFRKLCEANDDRNVLKKDNDL